MAQVSIKKFGLVSSTGTAARLFIQWDWTYINYPAAKYRWDDHGSATENFTVKWSYRLSDQESDDVWFTDYHTVDIILDADATLDPPRWEETGYQDEFDIPEKATVIKCSVIPNYKRVTDSNGNLYPIKWSAEYSTEKQWESSSAAVPNTGSITIEKDRIYRRELAMRIDNIENAVFVTFKVMKRDQSSTQWITHATSTSAVRYLNDEDQEKLRNGYARYSCTGLELGSVYRVYARFSKAGVNGDWFTNGEDVYTLPLPPDRIEVCRANSKDSVYLQWTNVRTATSYEIQYKNVSTWELTDYEKNDLNTIFGGSFELYLAHRFDTSPSGDSFYDTVDGILDNKTIINNISSGGEYYFRVRSKSSYCDDYTDIGKATPMWSPFASVKVGTKPEPPTVWSSTATAMTTDKITMYWTHNSKDDSVQTQANVKYSVGGKEFTYVYTEATPSDEIDKTYYFILDLSAISKLLDNPDSSDVRNELVEMGYTSSQINEFIKCAKEQVFKDLCINGGVVKWQVQTKGAIDDFSDWSSPVKEIAVYAPPTALLRLTNKSGEDVGDGKLVSYPLYLYAESGPSGQDCVSYHVSITTESSYDTIDFAGNPIYISAGQSIYSKYFDGDAFDGDEVGDPLSLTIGPKDVTFVNNQTYIVTVTTSMSSGLTAKQSSKIKIAWEESDWLPGATLLPDNVNYTMNICPYCRDSKEKLVNATLSVYRRNFDGTLTEIQSDIPNDGYSVVVDPHPALDYARYRIIATSNDNGGIICYDMPGVKIGCKAAILQWDEHWSNYDTPDYHLSTDSDWAGSTLKLLYNIDVSERADPDVNTIKYIGRSHPVAYYGTQIGESASWSVSIPKSDKETLYALRRLERWLGDVYVREPSGSGYWAHVTVSFSQTHRNLVIPVNIDITRVEGGV